MRKPVAQLSAKEKARRLARAKADAELEGDLPVFLGNPNSVFPVRPARPRKLVTRRRTKAAA